VATGPKTAGTIAWITAIAGLLTAIAAFGGLFKGSSDSSGSSGGATTSPQHATVPASGMSAADTTVAGSNAAPAPAVIYYQGHLEFGRLNLDLNPPKRTGDTYIAGGTGGVFESYHGAGKLAVWTSSGAPDRTGCGLAVDERGAEYISGVEKGNHVCGRTQEGRVFRIDVTGVSDNLFGGVTGDVTVWDK
jgi:hypothetical protein